MKNYYAQILAIVKKNIIIIKVSVSILIDKKITSSIYFIDGNFYIDLNGLKTLKTFIKLTFVFYVIIPIKLVKTIIKSNLLQLSRIYAFFEK